MNYDHVAAIALAIAAVVMLAWGIRRELSSRRDARAAAMRRHPSARTTPDFTSERARKYHESNQLGR